MSTASNHKHRASREEERRRLHKTVDAILDGANSNDVDSWVRESLVGIGLLISAAHAALYYETGRVISGTDRPHGFFPLNRSWEGAAIDVDSQRAAKWIADGEDALETPQPAEKRQRALAALLRPIASISLYAPLMELVEALDALPLGEVRRIVTRSPTKLHGYKEGLKIWHARKQALEWAEFQYRAKRMSKTKAESEVATAFGISEESVKDWRNKVKAVFGKAVVKEGLEWAAKMGCRSIRDELASCKVKKSAEVKRLEEYFESVYGRQKLDVLARVYKARKRRSGKRSSSNKAARPTDTRAGARPA